MIKYLLILALVLPSLSYAANRYVHPSGSGTACSDASPCSLNTAHGQSVAGDTIWLKDGTYNQSLKVTRGGTSNTARITYRAVNRHAAIVRFPNSGPHTHFHVDASWVTIKGLEIWGRAPNGSRAWDGSKSSDGGNQHGRLHGILWEDNYVHDIGHLQHWAGNSDGHPIELRYNTFDDSGYDDSQGEALYLGSCCDHPIAPGVMDIHHNIFSKYQANGVDFKGEQRDVYLHDNMWMDHKVWECSCGGSNCTNPSGACLDNDVGDAHFVIGVSGNDGSDSSTTNRLVDNIIVRPKSGTIFGFHDPVQVRAWGNVIYDHVTSPKVSSPRLNTATFDGGSFTYSNVHCPSEGMQGGASGTGGNPPNQINQPAATCTNRMREIMGVPDIASCNIGGVNNNTVTVDINTAKNGPVSSVRPLNVTYDGANLTGEVTTLPSGNQARIAVTTAPATANVAVRVVAVKGDVKNSAFLGGMTCGNGDNYTNANYTRGEGFCGENDAETVLCTNTTTGGGPPPLTEALTQSVYRFYQAHTAEGTEDLADENTNIVGRLGSEFRLRIGVRGGGNNAPSRSYSLAARVCKPTCGGWFHVSDDPSVGVVFMNDLELANGMPTTNRLSLGGKTFLAGTFVDVAAPTPAKAIASTQQIEWEFAMEIPSENAAAVVNDRIEFRMEHNDGTALSSYVLPGIVIGPGGALTFFGGTIISGTFNK